ncbi:helix-turn-helix transcriptional regulator [Rhizorhapis suberifaciens]|uniref:DNA-binding CsgD family transcriptional regulator n=1 Tax=Rhizorhapis suberifaciens TaxID=13656 RepID=A0A840HR38_9SPHN|nr:helix-turn-helix transcriptional regulator [Rhizorhapis suberifaciens]MBB4640109.1 DNA-binding CsgD family transcriptional regulator [Rhizorhapis suberifaciens]
MLKYVGELRDAALTWLDTSRLARLIVNEAFEILWANKAARLSLKEREFIEERDGFVCMTRAAVTVALQSRLSELHDNDIVVHSFNEGDLRGLVVVIRMLPCRSTPERLYGLELRWANEAESACYSGYRAYYGVTHAEDRVLGQLLKGHNVESCAASLNISLDTVRSHIRQLYSKMNVSSREALFYAMAPFRVQ